VCGRQAGFHLTGERASSFHCIKVKPKGSRTVCKNYRGITILSVPGKAFAFTLLSRNKAKLLESRRVEQSGFTSGRSTVDRILTLNTLIQTRREFGQPFWVAYVDLKSRQHSIRGTPLKNEDCSE